MNAPYGLEVIDSCLDCRLRKGFCDFSGSVLKHLARIAHQQTYPPGSSLFMEGQTPRGAFILCSGSVKLTTTTREGKVFILRMGTAGDVLGLSASLSQVPYEATAMTVSPCRASFLQRDELLGLLLKSGEAAVHAAHAISKDYQGTCEGIQEVLMAPSSMGKIAKLLLSWTTGSNDRELRVRSLLTHEEMAQMIGSSRETVTRIMSDLKRRELIRREGSTLVIRNRSELEELAS
jgi:CRP/FNR family transcriptional regulator, cyclic AMP receptor protein